MGRSMDKFGVAAALISCLSSAAGQAVEPVWNHEDYITSPPVYPSPNTTGIGWKDAYEKAKAWTSQLALTEKVQLTTGTRGPCVGNIAPIPRLNFSGICLQDGPLAIRQAIYASVFPAGLTVAAAWDRDLAYTRGYQIGEEFKGKGSHVYLGPVAGPLGRTGYGGRNWEGFSPDPYLTGVFMEKTIQGVQDAGVQASSKHFIGNEQETQRNPSISPNGNKIEAISANIDDRTLHELYLWPFADAAKAGSASFMCSYNRINGSYGCQNSKLLNGVLKEELGHEGYVVTDWLAAHTGWPAADAGLDMNMPGGISFTTESPSYWGANLTTSVNNGSLAESRLDDMIHRIMTPYFALGQDQGFPSIDPSTPSTQRNTNWTFPYGDTPFTYGVEIVDVRADHAQLIRELGAAGIVLLKNVNQTLPLKDPKNIGVFGNDAADLANGPYFANLISSLGFETGVLPVGGGSGTGRFTSAVSPLEAIKVRAGSDAVVQYITNNSALVGSEASGWNTINPVPEVCLVFLNTWASEGYDRDDLLLNWNGTEVVEAVAKECSNTVVITHSAGLNVLPFVDNPNVTAILAAHLSGEQVGNSVVDVLWGDVNPSGRLPYTIAKETGDYAFAPLTNSTELVETEDPNAWQQDFTERLLIDYRHFDYYNLSHEVEFEFGFGLSYTTFNVGTDLTITKTTSGGISALPATQEKAPGGNPELWKELFQIKAQVTNTGSLSGAVPVQLYLGLSAPEEEGPTPLKALRGFEKVTLEPGETKTVSFSLLRRDISYWSTVDQQWRISTDSVNVYVGLSSRDIHAQAEFSPLAAAAY